MILRQAGSIAPSSKLPGIQIARAVAALSVVYFHSKAALDPFPKDTAYPISWLTSYGWLGVDLFFAISGYVICLVVSRDGLIPGPFIVRRMFRLYPLWVATLTIFAIIIWLWRGWRPFETLGLFLYSATLLPTDGFPFYFVGWSLQHEMAFYVICALLMPTAGIYGLVIFLVMSTATVHLVALPWFFAQLAQYHADFLAGVLAFAAITQLRFIGPTVLLLTGGALLLLFLHFWVRLDFVPIALFFLIAGAASVPSSDTVLCRTAVGIGDSSYSLYLLHPIVLLFSKAVWMELPDRPLWIEEPVRFGSIAAIIVISLLSWRYFERPMIDLGNRIALQLLLRSRMYLELSR
jgi:exopolysaccharide production protein ExoZ